MAFPALLLGGLSVGFASYALAREIVTAIPNKPAHPAIENATIDQRRAAFDVAGEMMNVACNMAAGYQKKSVKIQDHIYVILKNGNIHFIIGGRQDKVPMYEKIIPLKSNPLNEVDGEELAGKIGIVKYYIQGRNWM